MVWLKWAEPVQVKGCERGGLMCKADMTGWNEMEQMG